MPSDERRELWESYSRSYSGVASSMDKVTIVAITLVSYKLLLVAIGFWASRRTHDEEDFFLGGRRLGPFVAALSYSSSSSSAWTLLGLSGAAYTLGVSAIWLVIGSMISMCVAWYWIAPRLMDRSRERDQLTLTDFLLDDSTGAIRAIMLVSISLIVLISFVFYIAAQFQGAGSAFSAAFDFSLNTSMLLGAFIIMLYTLMGGFWAVSVTDTVQGCLMAFAAILMPIAALLQVGGVSGFLTGLSAVSSVDQLSFSSGNAGLLAIGLALGGMSIGFGTYGQPHLLIRFMALRDKKSLERARLITIFWYALVFFGMYFLGLVGHVLHPMTDNPENIFFLLTDSLFSTVLGAVLLATVLSAIMSTADSQLLVAASAIAHDLRAGGGSISVLFVSRLSIVILVFTSLALATLVPQQIFDRVLFAWVALGAAFGPLLFMRLAGFEFALWAPIFSIWIGFGSAVLLYLLPSNVPGSLDDRLLPFFIALFALLPWAKKRAK